MIKKSLLVVLLFILLTAAFTYPLAPKIASVIPGFFSTDEPYGTLWDYWRVGFSLDHHLSLHYTYLIATPFGFDMFGTGADYYLHWFLRNLLARLTSPVISYNLQIFFNFVLTGVMIFLLGRKIGLKTSYALFSGIIFAFCPYQFARSWQHLSLTFNCLIALCLFTLIRLREYPVRANKIIFLLSLLLVFSFDYTIMYSTMVALAVFIIYAFISGWKTKLKDINRLYKDGLFLLRVIGLTALAMIVLLPQMLAVFKNITTTLDSSSFVARTYVKNFGDLFPQSARPLSYILPSISHPLFGTFTAQFIGSNSYGDSLTEHTLYLGWIPLILAFVALWQWKKKRKLSATSYQPSAENFYIGFFVSLAITAWLFSQAPWWQVGPLRIYMPSFFMYKILPMFRAYCRFGIVVMLAVAILAGFGLMFILEKFRTNKSKIAVTAVACGLVLFEFWNWPPYRVIDISKVPDAYYWLKAQPPDIVIAEYPLDIDSPNEMYKFYQTVHEKRMIDGTITGTEANRVARTLMKLSDRTTTSKLKEWHIRYVLVHSDEYLANGLLEDRLELEHISSNPDLRLIKSFPAQECPNQDIMCVSKSGPIDVYEVIGNEK